jgi:hypothetical protein
MNQKSSPIRSRTKGPKGRIKEKGENEKCNKQLKSFSDIIPLTGISIDNVNEYSNRISITITILFKRGMNNKKWSVNGNANSNIMMKRY